MTARSDRLARFPPVSEPASPFPTTPPLSAGLAELAGYWLDVTCPCKRGLYMLPLRMLAAQVGWRVPLGAVLARLRCRDCGGAPASVTLTDDPTNSAGSPSKGPPAHRLRLI